jgi:lipoprotein-anchoring transpeptidase ErfK/SrfK
MQGVTTETDTLSPEEAAGLPRHFVHVNRRRFRLTLYRRRSRDYVLVRRFRIAVGAVKHETPGGPYLVKAKARHPDWKMPFSDWVPVEQQGTVVPGDSPDNPIREAFIKLTDDGIGIHGTNSLFSLETKASHGCVRVTPEAAIYLYNRLETGDPVWIS